MVITRSGLDTAAVPNTVAPIIDPVEPNPVAEDPIIDPVEPNPVAEDPIIDPVEPIPIADDPVEPIPIADEPIIDPVEPIPIAVEPIIDPVEPIPVAEEPNLDPVDPRMACPPVPFPAVYIAGQKQGSKLLNLPDGYVLKKSKSETTKCGTNIYWMCNEPGCVVRATVREARDDEDMVTRLSGEHNHDNNLSKKTARNAETEAITAARTSQDVPRTVFGNLVTKLQAESPLAVAYLPTVKAFARKLQRARKEVLDAPPIPRTWEDMLVPESLSVTGDGQPFLISQETVNPMTGEKLIGFASPRCLNLLTNSTTWIVDGTFYIAENTLFKQVFIIHAKTDAGNFIPCSYFCLPNKERGTYEVMFRQLNNRGINPPQLMLSDFERGIISAFKAVYPGVPVSGCDTHFKRSIRKNIQQHGYQTMANSNEGFQTFVRYLWGLSLVPVEDIVTVWSDVVLKSVEDVDDEDFDALLATHERTYIGAVNFRTGERRAPMYEHDIWNKHNRILAGDPTTSNCAEGFNHAIALSIPNKADIWTVIQRFVREDGLAVIKLRDDARGLDVEAGRIRNMARERKKEVLKNLLANYGTMSSVDFMDSIVDYYNGNIIV